MGQGLSDLMYPSNPKLRERAYQLESDCKHIQEEFEQKKKRFEELEDSLAANIDAFLIKNGYSSFAELDAKLGAVLNSEKMKDWEKLKNTIAISEKVDKALWAVIGVAEAGGSAGISIAVALGLMSGPAGWAAAGALTAAVAIVALMGVVAAAIMGKIQQEKLKDAIVDLFHARMEMKVQVNRLDVLVSFLDGIDAYIRMTNDQTLEGYTWLFKMLEESYNMKWDPKYALDTLTYMDQKRGSYTGADPQPRMTEYSKLVKTKTKAELWKDAAGVIPADAGRSQIIAAEKLVRKNKPVLVSTRPMVLKSAA